MTGSLAVHRLASMPVDVYSRIMTRATAEIFAPELNASVHEIVEDVRKNGDEAVCRALACFDRVDCTPADLRVGEQERETARALVSADLLDAIRVGIANIRAFNALVMEGASWRAELESGLEVGEQATAIDSAGLFVPSGKGSFPSVLMQTGTPAIVAGVPRVVVVVPPAVGRGRAVDPAVLAVADELGLEHVVRVNGPAGIAALAFGTETIPRVSRVVGPGGPAVAAAQIQVQAYGCSTLMVLGPSESLTIADETADPVVLAADLLTEAEHGLDSAALLVTDSEELVEAVVREVDHQLVRLPEGRRRFAAAAVSHFGGAVLVEDIDAAVAFANEYGPEHLLVRTRDPDDLVARLVCAGEILLGDTPFSAANYVLGVPATLPTGGFARVSSGVTARTFMKTSSIARTSRAALALLAPAVVALAEHEGFPAHAAAIRARDL